MKIEFEQKELDKIEEYRNDPSANMIFSPVSSGDNVYSISFKVKDPAAAEVFIGSFLFSKQSTDIREMCGIDFLSLNFKDMSSSRMRDMVAEINSIFHKYLGE